MNEQAREAQFLSRGPERARPVRHRWGMLRPRDADAAHPALEKAYAAAKADPSFKAELETCSRTMSGAQPALFRRAADRELGGARVYFKREISATRAPTRQQRPRPGPARPQDGQEADHRRDRRRPARRRDGDRLRALRPQLRGLHGREDVKRQALNVCRMRLLGAKVLPVDWLANAQGRDKRGAARLGDQRRRHPLLPRLGGRASSLSRHGPRLPVGHRRGGARADPRADGRLPEPIACVGGGSNSIGLFRAFLGEPERRALRGRGGGPRHRRRRARGDVQRRSRRGAPRQL